MDSLTDRLKNGLGLPRACLLAKVSLAPDIKHGREQ